MAARKRASSSARSVSGRDGERRAGSEPSRAGSAQHAYNGAVREQLADLQRARILSATFDVAAGRGASNVSVAHIIERAGVSRRTFYEIFSHREDCLLAAFEDAVSCASERVLPAYQSGKTWREQIRAGLVALLGFLDEQPLIGRLLIVGSLSGGPGMQQARSEIIAALTRAVDQGRAQAKTEVPFLAGEGIVGGVLSVIHSRLVGEDGEPLVELTNPLMSTIVLPYLGPVAARRELDRPVPVSPGKPHADPLLSDPFKDAGMRITYRTVRVLSAIADLGGRGINPSNRLIADTAEIGDQGQISKLLSRLQRVGMITNTEATPGKGAPNSWTLTAKGAQVAKAIRAHTEGRQQKATSDEATRTHPHLRPQPHPTSL